MRHTRSPCIQTVRQSRTTHARSCSPPIKKLLWCTARPRALQLLSRATPSPQENRYSPHLLARNAVKGLVVGYRVGFCLIDESVLVVGWCIERVELECVGGRGVYDVVARTLRDDNGRTVTDCVLNAVEYRLPCALLHADKLVKLMDLFT